MACTPVLEWTAQTMGIKATIEAKEYRALYMVYPLVTAIIEHSVSRKRCCYMMQDHFIYSKLLFELSMRGRKERAGQCIWRI